MAGERFGTDGVRSARGSGVSAPASRPRTSDGVDRQRLEQFLGRRTGGSGTRPRVGTAVPVTVDKDDCERARVALRQLSTGAGVPGWIETAAVSLEISLERPLTCVQRRDRAMTLEFDVADCALMALALLHASDRYGSAEDDPDAYGRQARRFLERIGRSGRDPLDGRTPFARTASRT